MTAQTPLFLLLLPVSPVAIAPLMAAAGATPMGEYTIITRDDGNKQWAYKGHPLYTWKDDKKPGDITGDGFANGVWHVPQP